MKRTDKASTVKLAIGAVLTALVVILQYMGSFIKLGSFSISLVLIPIVIGTATCGKWIGAWLGFVFGGVVLLSGDAAAFLAVDVFGTVLTVFVKGIACGLAAGAVYELVYNLTKGKIYIAAVTAAVVCPVVNTGVFLLGCLLFFMEPVSQWAATLGFGENVFGYMILVLAGGNFVVEFLVNVLLSPAIVRIMKAVKK